MATLSVRIPSAIHRAAKQLAKRRGVSVNALVREGLAAILQSEEEKRFFDSFTLLGQDLEGSGVEYALPAQQEVMLQGEAAE